MATDWVALSRALDCITHRPLLIVQAERCSKVALLCLGRLYHSPTRLLGQNCEVKSQDVDLKLSNNGPVWYFISKVFSSSRRPTAISYRSQVCGQVSAALVPNLRSSTLSFASWCLRPHPNCDVPLMKFRFCVSCNLRDSYTYLGRC